jgi:DNA-binding response OmpR family regulator
MKVLLVDDEIEFVSTLAERLHMRGIEAEDVTSGHEAIERVKETQYDVVVLDLKMVGLDGLETMKKIHEMRPQTGVIILTGHCDEEQLNKGKEFGARCCLVKPINIEKLIEKIREACSQTGDGNARQGS